MLNGSGWEVGRELGLAFGLTLGPPPVAPGPLQWDAPPSCPDAAEVRERVEALLGFSWDGTRTRVSGAVEDAPDGWRLRLVMQSGATLDERMLDAPDCSELADAAAILIASSLRQEAELSENAPAEEATRTDAKEPRDAVRPVTSPAPAEPEPEPDPPKVPKSVKRLEQGIIRVEAGADFGTVAPVTGGLRVAVGLAWRFVRLELLGGYWLPRRRELKPGAGARLSMGTVEVRGCGRVKFAPFEFPMCLGIEAGAYRSRGYGLRNSTVGHAPWVAGVLSPSLVWRVHSRVGIAVGPQLWFALLRPKIVSQGPAGPEETIYRLPVVGGRATAGLEFRL